MAELTETRSVWQCIGCGRIVDERPCIGVCQDRRVEIVYAHDHADALLRVEELEDFLRRFAGLTPSGPHAAKTWQVLQDEARKLLSRT